jgi:type III pantothenate kinase
MLLIDVGNRALKAQFWRQNRLESSCRIRTRENWRSFLELFLSGIDSQDCYYAGVPGNSIKHELWQSLEEKFEPRKIRQMFPMRSAGKVVTGYPNPQGIGVDRWLAVLGAASLTDKDAIILDAGSAITLDLLKADGRHLGGAILPGFNTSLARFKKMLAVADFNHPDIHQLESPGLSTEHCIHIDHDLEDTRYLDRLIDRWFKILDEDAVLIITGGDARRIDRQSNRETLLVPDLVFNGMRQQLEYCA